MSDDLFTRIQGRGRRAAHPLAAAPHGPAPRPDPPDGARHVVVVILDSLRYDSLLAAQPRVLPRLGPIERRFTYATWTAPSHYALLTGLLPHRAPTGVVAHEVYRDDLGAWAPRLGLPAAGWGAMLPDLWLPRWLQAHGYQTGARVSLPTLNPATPLNRAFDDYTQAERHNDLPALLASLRFDGGRPWFWLVNAGETHYPYATAEEPEAHWPKLHGVHGVFRRLAAGAPVHASEAAEAFDAARLDLLRRRQVRAAAHCDRALEALFDACPRGTRIIVTADHGECFGEGGWFGHGPIPHEKVLEVPFVEGTV